LHGGELERTRVAVERVTAILGRHTGWTLTEIRGLSLPAMTRNLKLLSRA
tara:strand:+ start:1075 stop:1224 length:150 start_codon:yes stop_codon:yes gene_type:complete